MAMSMSMLPTSSDDHSTLLDHQSESFHKFFEGWLVEQNQHLKELVESESTHHTDEQLQALIDGVVEHYEHYYKAKSRYAKLNVLSMLSPTWRSTLEDAFLWIGGWRPTMAFHLLYSKSGLQFEARLHELIQGLKTCDLGDLSASQLAQIDEIQRKTIKEEREITDMMARHQETVADVSMVELSHVVSEMLRAEGAGAVGGECSEGNNNNNNKELENRVETALTPKEEGLEEILQKADDLRLATLEGIVNILTPKQGIHFLIAAAELHLRLHEWGKKKDAKKGSEGGGNGSAGGEGNNSHDSSSS